VTEDIKAEIAGELYTALERLDADAELLAIVGSWRAALTMRRCCRCCASGTRQGRRFIGRSRRCTAGN
jgi:hypothetical protein